jgi:hypothetical protein
MPILPQKTFRRDAIHRVSVMNRVYVIGVVRIQFCSEDAMNRVSTIGMGVFNLVLKTR